ncbi:hypothetical protein [Nonomuraea typhae]|uniref:Aminoglycoside phosphotransferase domain-containing protein n=1 Tax=Nonomuraea typhae TaxID=2603600 RepID=A0ABW7Z9G8_9ACTN
MSAWEVLPDRVRAAFAAWRESHDAEIGLVRWLSGGLSGAPVGVVHWHEPGAEDLQLIVKFLPDGPDEARLTRRALTNSPDEFRRRHLVELFNDPLPLGEWWMLRQRIAGGDLSMMKPLADLPQGADLAGTCAVITEALLSGWNPRPARSEPRTVRQYVRDHLGAKLGPEGALTRWAAGQGLSPDDEWVWGDGFGWLPNPLTLTADRPSEEADQTLYVQRGRAHGDLNARNVILSPDRPDGFKLIDLGRFADDAPLARDLAHLLLALAAGWVKQFTPQSANRAALIRAIVDPAAADDPAVTGYAAVARAVHDTAQEWAAAQGWGDQWRRQALLSLAGCGLLFAGRREVGADRRWFFDLAAHATGAYLLLAAPTGRRPPPPPRSGGTPAGVPREQAAIERRLDNQLGYFQRMLGNRKSLAGITMHLLPEDETFIRLAPCRISLATPGSGVMVLSDRHTYLADVDTDYRPSKVIAIPHGDLGDIVVHHDRRLGIMDTADIALTAASGRFLARGLLRGQAEDMVRDLERLTGLRHHGPA